MGEREAITRADGYVLGVRLCCYCGAPIGPNPRAVTCRAHSDLPALEPLDDRYLLTETPPHA